MSNVFNTNARADEAVFGGQPAARAVGLPTQQALPGTFAPGGSNQTAQSILGQMEANTQALMQPAQAEPREPMQGYNPQTNEVFSGGRTFKLDLNEGVQNQQLFDVDNQQLPQGFVPVRSSQLKGRLAREYENLGLIDATQRRFGQATSNIGSTLQDLGAEGIGQSMQSFGGALAARNPSKIEVAGDILDMPGTFAKEAIGEVVGYDVPVAIAQTLGGAAAGAKAGALLAPVTGGLSIPIGAFLGGVGTRFLGTLFETYGSVRSEQREQGIDARGRALFAGSGSAALEALLGPEARIAGQLARGVTREFAQEGAERGALSGANQMVERGRAGKLVRDVLQQSAIEGGTEVPQSALERFGAYQPLTGEDAMNEYIIGGLKGAVGSSPVAAVSSTIEFQQAKNFVENLKADMELAARTDVPSAVRLQAAKRAQDVIRGSSDDPQFDAVLQEFRQKLQFIDTQLVSAATNNALANGQAVDLLDTARQKDLFARGGERPQEPTEFDRTAEDFTQWRPAPVDTTDTPPVVDLTQPGQQSLFDETGAPTYGADTSFGESRFEFGQNLQGPTITPQQRTVAGFPALNEALDQIQAGTLPRSTQAPLTPGQELALQGPARPVTGELTPGQQAATAGPVPTTPIQRALGGVSLDLEPATPVSSPVVSESVGALPAAETPAAGTFSEQDQLVTRPDMPGFQFLPPQGETRGTQAPETQQTETQGQEASATDLESLIERENDKAAGRNPLEASVEGGQRVRAPGRVSLTAPQIARITGAMTDPEQRGKRLPAKERKIVDALVKFAQAYKAYLDAGGNMIRSGQIIKRGTTAEEAVEGRTQRAVDLGNEVRAALAELGQAVGGNAKDVDALVATVKAAAQGRINSISDPTMVAAYKRLDAMLSQAWTASKAETFIESLDPFYTRQEPTRAAREAKDQTPPLERAAEGQQNPRGQGPTYEGFLGVLHYIRFYGTGYERLLARQIREALVNAKNVPSVKFIDEGKSRYDPVTNTVFLHRKASNSVALHEGLHAALQWYVHKNPNNAAVKQLKASLKAVINYKGALGEKATAVQNLLKRLVEEGNEMDAVLELVSYGNTLNEFRKALDAMPRQTTPRTFYEAAQDVWQSVLAVVQKLLGNSKTEASAVIQSTWDLLAQIGDRGLTAPPTRQGNVLEAAITNEGTVDLVNMTPKQAAQDPSVAPMSEMDFRRMSKTLIPQWVSSKVLFDYLGWNKLTSLADSKIVTPLNNWIQDNSPGLTKVISWVNSHYALPAGTKDRLVDALTRSKDLRRGGSGIYEDLANYFVTLPPAQSKQVLEYMDAKLQSLRQKKKAPAFPVKDDKLKLLADATIDGWWTMAKAEPDPKLRDAMAGVQNEDGTWTGGARFTRSLVFPTSVSQLASRSFGARNVGQLMITRTKKEVDGDAIRFSLDENDSPVLTDDFVGLYKVTPALQARLDKGESLANIQPDEFIAAPVLERDGMPTGFRADPDYSWTLKGGSKDKGFTLNGRVDPLGAGVVRDGARLGHALQNTMAIMANSYSANTLTQSLYDLGRGDAATNPEAVVFDNVDELNRTLNGTYDEDGVFIPEKDAANWDVRVRQNQVVKISAEEAKSERVKGLYRHRNQWVQLPSGPTYGKLGGKIVNGAVWSAIEDMSDRRPLVNSAVYNGTMRWFKKAKTIYNPATWGTNVASNVTMAMMDDIPMATLAHASRLYALYHVSPGRLTKAELDLMVKIKNTNALLGDFSSNEVKQAIYESMKSTIDGEEGGIPQRVMQFFNMEKERSEKLTKLAGKGKDAVNKFDELAVDWYSAQDNVFRVASMLNKLGQAQDAGKVMDDETFRIAGDHARFAFLDYDIDSKAIRIMRQTAFPFISWPYAAAKLIGNVAVHRPWKLVNLYAGYWMIEAVMQAISGDDNDEDEAKRKVGPEWARERLLMGYGPHASIRVPFLGDDENPVFYNLGKYMIPSSFGERVPNGFMGQSWWPSFLSPGGPFITAAITGIGGVDPFNGQPLSPPTSTSWEAGTDRLKYLQSLFVPNLPYINLREIDRFSDAVSGRMDKTDSYAALYFARLAGLRLYDYNTKQAEIAQFRAARAIMGEYKQEISKLRRAEARLENPDWDSFIERQEALRERMMDEMAKARGEE
jgi:hypothetical protein